MNKHYINLLPFIFVMIALMPHCGGNDEATYDTTDIAMITPYQNSADISAIHEAFSVDDTAPWGFAHNGIDFSPSGNLKPFLAVSSGRVTMVKVQQNDRTSNYQVNVSIKYNDKYSVEYVFEPFSNAQSDGDTQKVNILVSAEQSVTQGDIIGYLYVVGSGAHVHFGLKKDGEWICPESYFTPEARESILNLIHKDHADWNMCYNPNP